MKKAIAETQEIAKKLNLTYIQIPGTIDYLIELLSLEWDPERFIIVEPHSSLEMSQCTCQ